MHHPARKTIGKVRELAAGYGGWIGAFKAFGADQFMNDEEIKADVLKWREESPEIVEMWGGQFRWCGPSKWDHRPELFGLEGAVINAILNPGQCFSHIDITYGVWDDILFCRLPSGRYLHYHRPRLASVADKLNRGTSYQITFEGYNSNSTKGPIGWHRLETYGGRLFENVVQAVALDIQAEALLRCEARGYPIVMHTHDEGVAEVPLGFGSVEEMAAIMSERPAWAAWWPLRAAGWRHERYQKD
jgi:DNA polymerase